MIKAGVIGLGVGEQHLDTLIRHPEVESVLIYDTNPDKLGEVQSRYHSGIPVYSEDEIIGNPDCELVCIASYDCDHFHQVMSSLDSDQNVFVENVWRLANV